ncbi:MAG: DNA cytosine methyltransferase, partial [Candidatus Fonsibacter sp.]
MDNKYIVSLRVLNTVAFGLPQNRPRLYVIGIKGVVLRGRQPPPLQWLRPVGCVPLASVFESGQVRKQPRPGTVADKSLHMLQAQLTGNKGNVPSTLVALDIFAPQGRFMV